MDKEQLTSLEPEALVEALSDWLDQTEEADFDPDVPSACLDALEEKVPDLPPFDAAAAEAAFRARHRDLFPQEVSPERRPFRLRRGLRRFAALAAAAVLCVALAAQGAGLDLFGSLARWSKGEFLLTTGQDLEGQEGYTDNIWEDSYSNGQAALDAYGVEEPMFPTWNPAWEGEDFPGLEVTVTQEADGTVLFVEDHRTSSGRGYTFEVRQRESAQAAQADVETQDALAYDFDGRTYYIRADGPGQYTITWSADRWSGRIYGDMDLPSAKHFARSVTQRDKYCYEPPDMSVPPEYETIQEAMEAVGIDTAYAPEWLPEGFVPVASDIYRSEHGDYRTAHLFCTDVEGERNLSLTFSLSSDPTATGSTVYPKDDTPVVEFQQGGVTFYIISNLEWKTVAWTDGGLSGSIGGGLTEEECRQIVASIPRYAQ